LRRRALGAVALLLLAGCGGRQPERPAYNDTDVMFLQMLLAHHEPSADLLALGRTRATRANLRALAAEAAAAHEADRRAMTGWLTAWGRPLTAATDATVHAGHGAGLHTLSDAEIAELAALGPAEFDVAFLNVFIGHQHNAVELARMELAGGAHPEVKEFARRIDQARRAQIQRMLRMVSAP
jgi:uncharacterized protein (DUF305 family)